jgi:hypothetical protein
MQLVPPVIHYLHHVLLHQYDEFLKIIYIPFCIIKQYLCPPTDLLSPPRARVTTSRLVGELK